MSSRSRFVRVILAIAIAFLIVFVPFFPSPALAAKDRVFLDLSLDFLGKYQLSNLDFSDAPVGISAITYDRRRDRFYAIGDKLYTLKRNVDFNNEDNIGIQSVNLESAIALTDKNGNTYADATIIPKGIALTPQQTVYISGSQLSSNHLIPFIQEFDVKTGRMLQSLPIRDRYFSDATNAKEQTKGIQDNSTFASLTFNATGTVPTSGEPINLFTATESPLVQDRELSNSEQGAKSRFLHYLIGYGSPMLLAEYAYPLNKDSLEETLSLESNHFLSLEKSQQQLTSSGKIYQFTTGGATDTSRIESLKGKIKGMRSIKKKLLLDLNELDIPTGNLQGMTFGPRLPDGTKSLIVLSNSDRATQFLLFRLKS